MREKGISEATIWIGFGLLMVLIVFGAMLYYQQYAQRAANEQVDIVNTEGYTNNPAVSFSYGKIYQNSYLTGGVYLGS